MVSVPIPDLVLGAELGRGSHGVVLRGLRGGRAYAVKLPIAADTAADREAAHRRFLREAAALARACHPALPAVLEVGRAGEVPYLVMELAAGETLAERLERGPLEESEAVSLAAQIAGALDAIHGAGLIHRDVKPRNIVFDGKSGAARLIDLGSAVVAPGGVFEVSRGYAAPEVLREGGEPVDARADLYSLGRVLQEALGQPPRSGKLAVGVSIGPASHIDEVLARLLAHDPRERYATALEALQDLARLFPGDVDPAAHVSNRRQRFLGRSAELEVLRREWGSAQRGGRVVLVQGPAGGGKTRLVRAFLDDVSAAGSTVLRASCHPRDPRAFTAVRQIVEAYLRECEMRPEAERARALAEVQRLAGDVGSLLKRLSPYLARVLRGAPTIATSENAEQAFSEGLSDFLSKLVGSLEKVVVFVDDAQWLDAGSLRVLGRAANRASETGGLFVLALRNARESGELTRLVELLNMPVARMELERLSDDDLVEMVRDQLAAPELDEEVKHAILRLSDGMPLHTLEVVRALVDGGALLPHWGRWQLDPAAAARMQLPAETASLLRHRIGAQGRQTREVLSVAAVLGTSFEEELVFAASPLDPADVRHALTEAVRAELVEEVGGGLRRFIHHTVREALLEACTGPELAEVHQRVAEAMDARSAPGGVAPGAPRAGASLLDSSAPDDADADQLYQIAFHFNAGVPGRTPAKAAEACIRAGRAAFERFDNSRAVEFLDAAERSLALIGRPLDTRERVLFAESRLRAGALDEALREFERALESPDPYVRASCLGRIASVHDVRFDSNRAWAAIEAAFAELGEPAPSESVAYVGDTVAGWASRKLSRRRSSRIGAEERVRLEALAHLYFQAGRVALNANRPARVVLGTLRAVRISERLGPSAALAKSYVVYSFVLTVLGFSRRGARYLSRAEDIAVGLNDPVLRPHILGARSVVEAWGGRIQKAVDALALCLTEYGPWTELGDYTEDAHNIAQMETVRGRYLEAWKWVDLAIQRVNLHEGAKVVHEFLLLSARSALVALGREEEIESRLSRLEQVTARVPTDSGQYASTFGARVSVFTEKANLGAAFEAVVEEFESLGQDPKKVHLKVTEYYVHVAHARVHACLRADAAARPSALRRLGAAAGNLTAAAKIDLIRAHACAVSGYVHWFEGRTVEAEQSFAEAERLSIQEAAPWVLYAVHRGRAHMLRAAGSAEAASDQAAVAESVALHHGAMHKARIIREEFGLRPRDGDFSASSAEVSSPADEATASPVSGAVRARRKLQALLRISQARARDLAPEHQARLVVDEIVQASRAERGLLFLTAGVARSRSASDTTGSDLEMEAGRDSAGRNLGADTDYDRSAVREALERSLGDGGEPSTNGRVRIGARRSAIASPLVVDDSTVGVIYVDRPLTEGVFTDADGELLGALSGQASVALELTRALRARERAEESLRNADKMEAVARLARSIAHDLNNMLSAIRLATGGMLLAPNAKEMMGEDLQTIQSALKRANELTRQLGTFSGGEFGMPQKVRPGSRIERLLPVVSGLLGDNVVVETDIPKMLPLIFIDPNQLDQIVMNLVLNARDAMPDGGRIEIALSAVTLGEGDWEDPRILPGRYARFVLSDTGCGMEEEVRRRVFEPYFTTKRGRGGTGLGLASVYWIVSQAGGHIEVASEVGKGTAFTIHFPADGLVDATGAVADASPAWTILVVEQDASAARQLEQTLVELGYRVLVAPSGPEALDVVRARTDVALVMTDVAMQGMNGLELARELRHVDEDVAVLLMSDADGAALAPAPTTVAGAGELPFLWKPVTRDTLAKRLQDLLPVRGIDSD